jgi:hypothetical protein
MMGTLAMGALLNESTQYRALDSFGSSLSAKNRSCPSWNNTRVLANGKKRLVIACFQERSCSRVRSGDTSTP